jgi:DNA-binding XRE family transcriptional regulator
MKKGGSNVVGAKLKEMGKTEGWLAKETGLGKSTISDLVSQKTGPSISTAVKISKAMGHSLEELFLLE